VNIFVHAFMFVYVKCSSSSRRQSLDILTLHGSCLLQLNHDVRNLDILFILIFRSNLKDDIFLVVRYWLLADVLDQLAHPKQCQYK
jgi:hypothetical protein